ncbi:hypothetical protein WA026_014174 [Henosepilachna vigintioctopunctata]|uniref:Uncharacterized protein n=1 Tax=Henosepilachna vigintioctopunctata TaxID=420089 RepID=A0AAW1TKH2_9CUCU
MIIKNLEEKCEYLPAANPSYVYSFWLQKKMRVYPLLADTSNQGCEGILNIVKERNEKTIANNNVESMQSARDENISNEEKGIEKKKKLQLVIHRASDSNPKL